MAKSKVTKLFDIRVQEVTDKETGKVTKKAKAQFVKGIEIRVNGEKVNLGKYNSVFLKTKAEVIDSLNYAVENFGLTEDYVEKQVQYMEDKNVSSVCEVVEKN
jgi:hypothetical protein